MTTAISRYFSTAASPSSSEPRKAAGNGSGMVCAPQITLINSSPTIIPPMVIMICFRCWPYTGRMITRSKAKPTPPATAIATSIAGSTAMRLRNRLSLPVQPVIAPSTETAR